MALRPISNAEELAKIPVNEEVLVELPAGVTGEDTPSKAATDTKPETDVEALKRQFDASIANERRLREQREQELAAERQRRQQADENAARFQEERLKSNKDSLDAALEGAQAEEEAATVALQQAHDAGDTAAIAKTQQRLARAAARVVQVERAQSDYEASAAVTRQAPITERKPAPAGNVLDQMRADPNLLPTEKEWIEKHPETLLDRNKNMELGVAHNKAVAKGLSRGSDAYFSFINDFMGYAVEDDANGNTNVSAPVSRGSSAQVNGGGDNRIHLSAEQREMARTMGISDIQMAQGVQRLAQEKRNNPEKYAIRN